MIYKPARIYKRGNNYQLYFYRPSGERRRISVGKNYQHAQRMAVKFDDLLLRGIDPELEVERERKESSAQSITLKELFPVFFERHGVLQSKSTQTLYKERFKNIERCPALSGVSISYITKKIVYDFMHLRKEHDGVSNATVNREATLIKNMLNKGVEWGYLPSNPISGLKLLAEAPKRNVDITQEEAAKLLAELPEPVANIVEFAIYTGFRKENILGLTIDQVIFHDVGNTGDVRLKIKSGRHETFPICENAVELLKRIIGGRKGGYVFINPNTGNRYTTIGKTFQRAVRRINLRVGDSYLCFHDCRHIFSTWMARKGVSLDSLRLLLGHKKRSTTDRYVTAHAAGARNVLSLMPKIESPNRDRVKAC